MRFSFCILASAFSLMSGAAFAQLPLSDPELAEARGGYLTAEGFKFNFGAVIRTFDGDKLALETNVIWTPEGPQAIQTPGGLATSGGATFVHGVKGGDLANMVINTDSNRDFRQETNITLVLPGFEGVQADIGRALSGMRLADDVAAGAIRSLGN